MSGRDYLLQVARNLADIGLDMDKTIEQLESLHSGGEITRFVTENS